MVLLSKSKVMFWRKEVNENFSRSVGSQWLEASEERGKSGASILRRQQYQCKTFESILELNKYKCLLTKDSREGN
jgi:hypothetical protein